MKSSEISRIVSAWEHDPDQGFTDIERDVLERKGLIKRQVNNIL